MITGFGAIYLLVIHPSIHPFIHLFVSGSKAHKNSTLIKTLKERHAEKTD